MRDQDQRESLRSSPLPREPFEDRVIGAVRMVACWRTTTVQTGGGSGARADGAAERSGVQLQVQVLGRQGARLAV